MRCFTPTKCANGQKYCSIRRKTVSQSSRPNTVRRTNATTSPSIIDASTASPTPETTTVRSTRNLPTKAKAEMNKPIYENIANKLSSMKVKRKNINFTLD
jgi:hypothetical protein